MSELKPIVIRDEEIGKTYTLRFTRATVRKMEQDGFNIMTFEEKPMTNLPELFYGSFLADQPYMKRKDTDAILFDKLQGLSQQFIEKLSALYNEPFNTLIAGEGEPQNPCKMTVEL